VKKWEYMFIGFCNGLDSTQERLNKLGNQGWKVIHHINETAHSDHCILMEREIPESESDKPIDLAAVNHPNRNLDGNDDSEHPADYGGFD